MIFLTGARISIAVVFTVLFSALSFCVQAQENRILSKVPVSDDVVLRGHDAKFLVNLALNEKSHTYHDGDEIVLQVTSEEDGFVYLVNIQPPEKKGFCRYVVVFPNPWDQDNRVSAGKTLNIPTPQAENVIVAQPPFGKEKFVAIVSKTQVGPGIFGLREFDSSIATLPNSENIVKKIGVVSGGRYGVTRTEVLTLPKGGIPPKPAKFALYVGIEKYVDKKLDDLPAVSSMQLFSETMAKYCGYSDRKRIVFLTNKDASLRGIREAFDRLRESTQAGDEVVIYWNGHGTHLAATEKKHSPDGRRGYLMPYDTKMLASGIYDAETMISDLEFGNWINAMNDRKIFIFLDTCYSGTFVEATTSPVSSRVGKPSKVEIANSVRPENKKKSGDAEFEFDFLKRMMDRSRSILKDDAVVICASQRNEDSWAVEGEYAIATRLFCAAIQQASGTFTVENAFSVMSRNMPAAIETLRKRDSIVTPQTPVLQGNAKRFFLMTSPKNSSVTSENYE